MRALELFVAALLLALPVAAQKSHTMVERQSYYAPLNSWSVTTEYSNSSSHIILGSTRQRKFAGLTLAYQRRISANRWMAWDYSFELRPFLVESDPTFRGRRITTTINGQTDVFDYRSPQQIPIENANVFADTALSGVLQDGTPFSETIHTYIGRRWTYAPGITPACFTVHLLPAHRLQPFLDSTGGFVVSPRDIPVFQSSAFNFTFSFGGGIEYFRDHQHSWSLDYRVEHLSNKSIGYQNPGIDSQFIRVGYRYGR